MSGLACVISGSCAIAIAASAFYLSPDTQSDERVRVLERVATPLQEQCQIRVPTVADVPGAEREEASSTLHPIADNSQRTQQVAELSATVERLEHTVQDLEHAVQDLEARQSRVVRPLQTGDRTEAGLAGKKAEVDAQARRSQVAVAELQRFAVRFGVVLDERVLSDSTLSTPLDNQPGFKELRLAATSSLRVLQAVEKKFATHLLDRASFQ